MLVNEKLGDTIKILVLGSRLLRNATELAMNVFPVRLDRQATMNLYSGELRALIKAICGAIGTILDTSRNPCIGNLRNLDSTGKSSISV
jgi:hypothetical protein|tara:strand:+ start:37 stop:303 length:267 start_codon:yes stop_codon:yes gene_type:complete